MLRKFFLRDAALILVTVGAWTLLARHSAGSGPVADAAGFLAGGLVGLCGFALHEWGHLLAGRASGGNFPLARNPRAIFWFGIDPANTIRQFTVMSLGGFAVTAATLLFAYLVLPGDLLATRVARGAALFGALLTLVLEMPLLLVGLATGRIPAVASVAKSAAASPAAPQGAA